MKTRFPGRAALASALLLASMIFSGCYFGGSTHETKYYTLDYIPSPSPERLKRGPYPFTVRLKDPTIAEAYRRSQIVYRQSAYQMLFYSYHLWAVDPDRMIGDLLLKHLSAARLFENVFRSVEAFNPDFQLTADIQAIEEYDGPDVWYSHLAIEYQLIDAKTGQVLFKKLYDLRKAVPRQDPVFVVRELSSLLETIQGHLIQDLEVTLDEAAHRPAADSTRVPRKR